MRSRTNVELFRIVQACLYVVNQSIVDTDLEERRPFLDQRWIRTIPIDLASACSVATIRLIRPQTSPVDETFREEVLWSETNARSLSH